MVSSLINGRAAYWSRAICILVCVVCLSPMVAAQDGGPKPAKPFDSDDGTSEPLAVEPLVFGTVVNQDGVPVANAKVWLVLGSDDAAEVLGETMTDDQGEFALVEIGDEDTVFRNPRLLTVWARHPAEGLAWFGGLHNYKRKPLSLQLGPATTSFTGQLIGPEGQPLAGVRVIPKLFYAARINEPGSNVGQLSPDLSQRWTTTTNEDGRFEIADLPEDGIVDCDVAAPGFDQLRISWNLDKSIVTKIDPGVSFSGQVVWPAEVNIPTDEDFNFGTVKLTAYSMFQADGSLTTDSNQKAFRTISTYSIKIDQAGQFHLDHIAPGKYYLSTEFSPILPLLPSGSEPVEIQPGTVVDDFKLVAEKAFKVSGRVVGFENQVGIANAVVRFSNAVEGRRIHGGSTTTDQDGNYFAYVKQGENLFRVAEAPPEFIPAPTTFDSEWAKSRVPKILVTEDMICPDLILDPACDVTLQVFDENGKPAAGAFVKITAVAGYPAGQDYQAEQRTDAEGKYIARRVTANDTLPICVYTPTAISELDLVITPQALKGPVRIDLSPDFGFRIRCRVVDSDDEPIANANVSVGTYFFYVSKWSGERESAISGSAGQGVTDSDGFFESGPLWPDRPYQITVNAEGYGPNETPRVEGKIGEVVELKPIVLSTAKASKIVGTVIDSAKQPVAGVQVFAAGSGYQLATAQTNAAGQFELDNVAADIRYLFVNGGPHYRLGGARVGNQQPLEITIRAFDSPPQGIRPYRTTPREEQLAAANDLIEKVWSLPANVRIMAQHDLLRAMEQVDPTRATEKALAIGRGYERYVLVEQAFRTVDDDPERALRYLQIVSNRSGVAMATSLGMKLATSDTETDRKTAIQFADLALKLAAGETIYNLQLARLFTSLDRHEKAQALIDDVLKPIDLNNLTEQQNSVLIELAPAIAPYDFEQARSFASLAEEGASRTFALADIAVAMVATDHEKAIREIEALTGDSNAPNIRDKARFRAAYLLIATHSDLAIKLVQQCEDDGNRAQALGRLAVRVAEFDQPQAWKMIDEALAIHRNHPEAFRGWMHYGGAGTFAAGLAYHAQQVEYPDMESVIWHVRRSCRANDDEGQTRLSATVKTARMLALVDKIAARDLLNAVADKIDQFPRDEGSDSLYDQWLQAWLLVDFGRGVKLLNDELDELKNSDEKEQHRYGHNRVFRLLVSPPEERYKLLIRETGLWKLEEDGTMEMR